MAKSLAWFIGALLVLHTVSQVFRFGFGFEYQMGLAERLYFGAELNLPTWFASSIILLNGLLLLWIARATALQRRRGARYWGALGVIFVLLSADEAASFHELLSPVFAGTMMHLGEQVGGIFVPLSGKAELYAWVIPGVVATFVVGLVFLRFLRLLPARTRLLFIASGAVFLTGALGLEIAGGRYSGLYGADTVTFVVIMTLEETLEKVGMSMFLYALLCYIEAEFGVLAVRLDRAAPADLRHVA